jgi:hypothetical protein
MEVFEENIDVNGSLRKNFFFTFNFDTFLFSGDRNRCVEEFREPPSWQLFINQQAKTDLTLVEIRVSLLLMVTNNLHIHLYVELKRACTY